MERIELDIFGPFPVSKKDLMIVSCYFIKYVDAISLEIQDCLQVAKQVHAYIWCAFVDAQISEIKL